MTQKSVKLPAKSQPKLLSMGLLPYYHRWLTRKDTRDVLEQNGDFLLRKTKIGNEDTLVVSVLWLGEIRHFPIQRAEGRYCFETRAFRTVKDLIQWHHSTCSPVTEQSGAILKVGKSLMDWELLEHQIQFLENGEITEGRYAEICEGKLFLRNGTERTVAIKALIMENDVSRGQIAEGRESLLHEARRLREVCDHPNIVTCFGVTITNTEIMMAIELMSSDLAMRLVHQPPLNVESKTKLLKWAVCALAHVHGHGLVHRNLCARNCLIIPKPPDELFTLKLTGFDYCEKLDSKGSFVDNAMPPVNLRFCAPESLANFSWTKASDVWSFAVFTYEVFNDGAPPYANELAKVPKAQIPTALSNSLQNGNRLPAPASAPNVVKSFWDNALKMDPAHRPTAYDLADMFFKAIPMPRQ